jgi:hypothetical protein
MSVARRLRNLIHMAHEEGISDLIDL